MKQLPLLTAPLPTPDEMRLWDEAASQQFGIPPLLLMENAAQAALRELKRHVPLSQDTKALIFMGRGNNGGDGAALARLLYDEGCSVLVYTLAPLPAEPQSPSERHAAIANGLGVNFLDGSNFNVPALPLDWRTADIIVDAITGTGLRGELRPQELACVTAINRSRETAFVFSLDIPSGLCGMTGRPRPEAVRAHATVCFEAGKPGLFFPEAAEYTGCLAVRRVGIPLSIRTMFLPSWELLAPAKGVYPLPSPFRHKGDGGKVLVIGGSEGMAGAPLLAALGCLRAGTGLVHVARPGGLSPAIALPEVQDHPIGHGLRWEAKHGAELERLIARIAPDTLVIGPGMGRDNAVQQIIKALLEKDGRPSAVVDADALYCFRAHADGAQPLLPLSLLGKNDIVTPHPGEMARLLPAQPAETGDASWERTAWVQKNRPEALAAFTAACDAVLVLKGAGTLIGRKDTATVLCPIAVPTLAVGGSGDVLSGICGALAASGMASPDAAKLAVYLHARAGELLMERAPLGHLARDIADAVPLVWSELCNA